MAGLEIPARQQEMLVDRSRALLRVEQKANLTLHLFPYARFFFWGGGGEYALSSSLCFLPYVNTFVYIFPVRHSVCMYVWP